MKKIVVYFFTIVLISIYGLSLSPGRMRKFVAQKYASNSIWGSDKYRYGDLFGMSYFPLIKERMGSDRLEVPKHLFQVKPHLALYVVHDSYLSNAFLHSKSQINGVDTLYHIKLRWENYAPTHIALDSGKVNILLVETVERNLFMLDSANVLNLFDFTVGFPVPENTVSRGPLQFKWWNIFNPEINTNLEFVLFDTRIFTPLKELKSYLNYKLFHKLNPDVFLSENSEYLFYAPTRTSIEQPVSGQEIEKKVSVLNMMYDYYKSNGFDEVYFSIIPDPVSVIKPDCKKYRNLIPMIQNHPKLKMKMIDIYSVFRDTKYRVYYHADSHWNKNGSQLWLNELNKVLYQREERDVIANP